jgi:ElaB/YqjD/DUF883 family membrane-anchored ribosome-binding protein
MGLFGGTGLHSGKGSQGGMEGDFKTFVGDVEKVMKQIQNLTGDGLSLARSELEGKIATARTRFSEAGKTAADTAARTKGAMEEYVAQKPWPALAAAIAIGAIAAILLSRGRRS